MNSVIEAILKKAPPVPAIKRQRVPDDRTLRDETKSKLLLLAVKPADEWSN